MLNLILAPLVEFLRELVHCLERNSYMLEGNLLLSTHRKTVSRLCSILDLPSIDIPLRAERLDIVPHLANEGLPYLDFGRKGKRTEVQRNVDA